MSHLLLQIIKGVGWRQSPLTKKINLVVPVKKYRAHCPVGVSANSAYGHILVMHNFFKIFVKTIDKNRLFY
jgi:hypothetical protein